MDNIKIYLTDEDGVQTEFDLLGMVTLDDGREFVVLLDEESDYVTIRQLGETGENEVEYLSADEDTIRNVFKLFCEKYKDVYEVEED